MSTPAIVIFRDRVSYAQQCVAALKRAGLEVHIVDHGTTYAPAREWLAAVDVPVHQRDNAHPRDLWTWPSLRDIVGLRRYVVTDPDVVPDDDCPNDWVSYLGRLLDVRPGWVKAGLGLRVDDLPEHYEHAAQVKTWEQQWWEWEISDQVYNASVDTTLALYRSLDENPRFALNPSLRTGKPYVARHLTWYENSATPTEEDRYYRAHATPLVSHWADPGAYLREVVEPRV